MNYVTIPLSEYAKKVEELNPDVWVLMYASHNKVELINGDDGKHAILSKPLELEIGAGTNKNNAGTAIILVQATLEYLKKMHGITQ